MAVVDQSEELAEAEPMAVDSGPRWSLGGRGPSSTAKLIVGALAVVGVLVWAVFEEKIRATIIAVVVAVVGSAGVWIAANLLFNQVRSRWERFNVIAFACIGALVGILIHGNQLTVGSGEGLLPWVIGPIVGAAVLGATGYALAITDDPARRLTIGLAAGIGSGVLVGLLIREEYHPELDPVATVAYTAVFAAIGAGLGAWRGRPWLGGALIGAAVGWLLGAWGGADLGDGSIATSLVAAVVLGALVGVRGP